MSSKPLSDEVLEQIREQLKLLREKSYAKIEPLEKRAERYLEKFRIGVDHLKVMVDSFVHELDVGLLAHLKHPNEWDPRECSFKMLDACVPKLPSGKERGAFYAMDFGGTSFRVVRLNLHGDGTVDVAKKQVSLLSGMESSAECPKGLLDSRATASQMFDFFAQVVKEFMAENKDGALVDGGAGATAGFTFSFPCQQTAIDTAVLMSWTKGFETGRQSDDPVESLDVVELINVAFTRNQMNMVCNSVMNDTVGTLISCAYSLDAKSPPCLVGMILGTGMNCCYWEERAQEFGYTGRLINIECGNFNRELPRTTADCELDFKAVDTRGLQQIEKMCSGAYLGEICRLTVLKIFANRAPARAWQAFSLSTENTANIMNDKSRELIVTYKVINEAWRVEMTQQDLEIMHRVATAVMDRSAALAAVMVAACSKKTGRLRPVYGGVTVAMDGSLYRKNQWYQQRMRYHLDSILTPEISSMINIVISDDGSGKGAGILAATLV